jgi:hypothetical protein
MGETNSPSVAHVGYDISEWKNIVTHGQLKENLYLTFFNRHELRLT